MKDSPTRGFQQRGGSQEDKNQGQNEKKERIKTKGKEVKEGSQIKYNGGTG